MKCCKTFILSLFIVLGVIVLSSTTYAASVCFPRSHGAPALQTGTTSIDFSIPEGYMIYDYVIQNSQGDVITSREFPIRIRGQRPAYGSFSINNPGTYRIAWTYGGWDLVMMNVNGTYTYVERQNGRDVKTFYQTFSVVEKEKVQQNVIVSTLSQKTYGDQHFYIEIEDDNEELGDFSFSSSNTDVAKIYSDGGIYIKGAGTTDITVSRSGDDDFYNYTYTQTFTVKKRNITVNANPASKKVGKGDPELTYTYSGTLVGNDEFTGSLTRRYGESVGRYDILIGTLAINDNYNIIYNKAIFEIVDKTSQNIVVDGIVTEKTYGDDGFKVTVTPDSTSQLNNFTFSSSNTDVATIDAKGNVVVKNAGVTEISVKEVGNADYKAFEKKWTLTVNKVPITVTAENKTKKIGQDDPELTYTYTGELVGSDKFTGSLTRNPGEEIGQYNILIGTLAINNNYNITYNKATFEIVDKIAQNVDVDGIVTEITYGDDGFKVNVTPDSTSQLDSFAFSSSNKNIATIDEEGNVVIKNAGVTEISVKEPGNVDYKAFEKKWTLTVNKVPITVTAENKTKRIGQEDPELTFTYIGKLVGSDAFTGALTRTDGEKIGQYDILIGSLALNDNYDITFNGAKFEIINKTPQSIIVSKIPKKTYGDASFTIEVTPDVNSQLNQFDFESSNKNVAEVAEDGIVTIKGAGITNIKVKQAGNSDYAEIEKTVSLTVKKAPITIAAKDVTIRVGSPVPTFDSNSYTITVGTLFSGDTITGSLATSCRSTSSVKNYSITKGTLKVSSNYTMTFVPGTLSVVDKNPQNIVVDGIVTEKTYGDDGFKINVTPDSISQLDNFTFSSSDANVATIDEEGTVNIKNAGTTEIVVKEAGNEDYAAFEKKWTLTVKKRPITITAENKTKRVGQDDPELTYTYTGTLVGEDMFAGTLTRKTGEKIGKYDILQGTLALNNNYILSYNKALFEIVDKTPQNIVVDRVVTEKNYGDDGFKVTIIPDSTSQLNGFTFTSSNTNVATIDAEGNVVIKNAGTTEIAVKEGGNTDYAPFEQKWTLTVNKLEITVTAETKFKKEGQTDPELTFTYTGILVGDDAFTGSLTRRYGESVGRYDILLGTLTINDNYNITYNKAIFEILDKTPQTIAITDFPAKTYGDTGFTIEVTPDATSMLDTFTFASSDEKVATVDENGVVTIIGVGRTEITVTQAGNDEYAVATVTKSLAVEQKEVIVKTIDLDNKTAELSGVLDGDASNVELDFSKILIKFVSENSDVEESIPVYATSFYLVGDMAENYVVISERIETVVSGDMIVTVSVTAENGTVAGAGTYLKGSDITFVATPNNGYKFSGWYEENTLVSKNATYTFSADVHVALVAKFSKRSFGGGGGSSTSTTYTVEFQTSGNEKISNQSIEKNGLVVEPTAPTREGFTFEGWFADKELTAAYDFSAKVTKSFTLYAKWSEIAKEPDEEKPVDNGETEDKNETETVEWKNPLGDIKADDWFYKNVQYVVENKLMNGVAEDKFAPNEPLTRAMLVTVLYRNEGEPAVNKSIPFADVDMGSWYVNAVVWAKQNGIVNGVTENEFAPDENITREQIAAIMFRYAQYKGMDAVTLEENLHFADANEISEYAVSAMNWAVGTGLIKGKSTTTINPKDNATRAEIAAILQRFIENDK